MKPKLKICGMREPQNIVEVASVLPDYMGFIYYTKSPRFVGNNFSLPQNFPIAINKVAVFVNESTENMMAQVQSNRYEYVQLHGHETIAQCAELKAAGINIIKAFSVHDSFDFDSDSVNEYQSVVDYVLFDTAGRNAGGNGVSFDWTRLNEYNQRIPFILSGGISLQNILHLKKLEDMNLHAVDINSGVEICPGVKDVNLIKQLSQKLSVLF
jgi:phosphoribosylanthranilate isomerase